MIKLQNAKIDFMNDPLANMKYLNIKNLRYLSDRARNIKEAMYSKIYFSLSIIFTVFIAIFAQSLNWMMVWVFVDILLGILILFAWSFCRQRSENTRAAYRIGNDLSKMGVNVKFPNDIPKSPKTDNINP